MVEASLASKMTASCDDAGMLVLPVVSAGRPLGSACVISDPPTARPGGRGSPGVEQRRWDSSLPLTFHAYENFRTGPLGLVRVNLGKRPLSTTSDGLATTGVATPLGSALLN